MQAPARSNSAGLLRHRTIGVTAVVSLVVALACSCAHTGSPPAEAAYGADIATNTPQGLRAKQILDMVNSDWPIDAANVGTFATPDIVEGVTGAMDRMWWDRPINVTGIELGAGTATVHVATSYKVSQDIELRTNDEGMVDRFDAPIVKPEIARWSDVDAEFTKSGAHYSYAASKVNDGTCTKVAGTNVDESLPLASIFKLYVLLAVADAVKAGTVRWDDQLTITATDEAIPSELDRLPRGTQVSVREAAQHMISSSDNAATDLLMARVGTAAVERALVTAHHHDPAKMTPLPNTHELFSIGWGKPDLREQWKNGTAEDHARLLQQANSRPWQADPERSHVPASPYGVEWYGSAMDICRVHAALQAAAVGPAAPVRDILSATPGIDLDKANWGYVGAKGGNLPGDMTFSWYAEDRSGQAWVVSFQMSWPAYRSLTAAEWMLSIAKQSFAMIPVGRTS